MKMVQKTTAFERVNHFVLLVSFFILVLTGFGFAFHTLNWINTMFGGNHLASIFHKWGGVVFAVSVLLTIFSYFSEAMRFDEDDRKWLSVLGGYFDKSAEVPPSGKMNMGQKIFFLVVVLVCGGLISITGFMIWAGSALAFAHLVHYLTFLLMVIALPLHIYLATAANPGTFRIMTKGTIPLYFAKKKYGKWVKEAGLE
jgi:formate dehydrogenase subunit gamma